ncbi:MAG: HD domain-containing protein [Lactobacillaceae bacterium]|jgi:3'-5' exoribonuclease|nr:HD domain-containing protein [Lactobacillaceae bacterium]
MQIKDIKKLNKNDQVSGHFLLSSVTVKTASNGSQYLDISMQDKTGTLPLKVWSATPENIEQFVQGSVVYIQTVLDEFKGTKQIAINPNNSAQVITLMPESDPLSKKSLYMEIAPLTKEQLQDEVNELLLQVDNEIWNRVLREFLTQSGKEYFEFPAAKSIHQAYPGGLAWHSILVAKLALSIADNYPDEMINRSLLIAGALLHDAGKIRELSITGGTSYTVAGTLIGHIVISDEIVVKIVEKLGYNQDAEDVILLRHMILSHQGKLEWSTPVEPETLEAFILSQADNIDAKIQSIQGALTNTEPGDFSEKVFAADGKKYYKATDNH